MKKRLICLLMALVLCISLLPVYAIEDELSEAEPLDLEDVEPSEDERGDENEEKDEDDAPDEDEPVPTQSEDGEIVDMEVDLSGYMLQAGGTEILRLEDAAEFLPLDGENEEATETLSPYNTILEALRKCEEKIDLSAMNLDAEQALALALCVINQHPELFYVASSANVSYYKYTDGTTKAISFTPTYRTSLQGEDKKAAFDAAVENVTSQVLDSWSVQEKALFLHDYIVTHCRYSLDNEDTCRSAYGCLVEHVAVCQGISLAYMYLLNKCGVTADMVISKGLNHAWNIITLDDGEQYFIDATWDDSKVYEAYCEHTNFLRSADGMYETGHTEEALLEEKERSEGSVGNTDWVNTSGASVMDVTAETYDDAFWCDSDYVNSFVYYYGAWYGVRYDSTKENYKQFEIYTLNLPDGEVCEKIDTVSCGYWWAGETTVYHPVYGTLAVYNKNLYVSGPTDLYKFDGETFASVYKLTSEEKGSGYIYGLLPTENGLQYAIQTEPSEAGFTGAVNHYYVGEKIEVEIEADSHITVTAPTLGWVEGNNTFTVQSSDENGYVVWTSQDGSSYSRQEATANGDGTYSFTDSRMANGEKIRIVRKGDWNGDEKVDDTDIAAIRKAAVGLGAYTSLQYDVADVDWYGDISALEILQLRLNAAGSYTFAWDVPSAD